MIDGRTCPGCVFGVLFAPATAAANAPGACSAAAHDVTFSFGAFGLASATGVIVYDTSEVPSGISFNVQTLPETIPTFSTGF